MNENISYQIYKSYDKWICIATAIDRVIDFKVTGVGETTEEAIQDANREFEEVLRKL